MWDLFPADENFDLELCTFVTGRQHTIFSSWKKKFVSYHLAIVKSVQDMCFSIMLYPGCTLGLPTDRIRVRLYNYGKFTGLTVHSTAVNHIESVLVWLAGYCPHIKNCSLSNISLL